MKRFLKFVCVSGFFFSQNISSAIEPGEVANPAYSVEGPSYNWIEIPGTQDAVAFSTIGKQHVYIHPDKPTLKLPGGAFFFKSKEDVWLADLDDNAQRPLFTANHDGHLIDKPFLFTPDMQLIHIPAGKREVLERFDHAGRCIDPLPSMSSWRMGEVEEDARSGDSSEESEITVRTTPSEQVRTHDAQQAFAIRIKKIMEGITDLKDGARLAIKGTDTVTTYFGLKRSVPLMGVISETSQRITQRAQSFGSIRGINILRTILFGQATAGAVQLIGGIMQVRKGLRALNVSI